MSGPEVDGMVEDASVAGIPDEMIGNLVVNALEGGSNYWYRIEERIGAGREKRLCADERLLGGGGYIVSDFNGNDGDESTMRKGELTLETGRRALVLMAEKHPHHFADVVSENDDATTADVFLQLCVLGEVIYG